MKHLIGKGNLSTDGHRSFALRESGTRWIIFEGSKKTDQYFLNERSWFSQYFWLPFILILSEACSGIPIATCDYKLFESRM